MHYTPLAFHAFEFRLLEILTDKAETSNSTVRCKISHSNLIDPPEYRALSYCWGDPLVTRPIIVNGETRQVTTNLEEALQAVKAQGFRKIWVDALCINQDDLLERGLQVTRMGLIYFKARQVIAWLGVEAENSSLACSMVRSRRFRNVTSTTSSGSSSTTSVIASSISSFSYINDRRTRARRFPRARKITQPCNWISPSNKSSPSGDQSNSWT